MKVTIGCTDGQSYTTGNVDNGLIMTELKEKDYVIGYDRSGKVYARTIEEVAEYFRDMAARDTNKRTQTLTLHIKGKNRQFNVEHIVWTQVEV